MRTKRFNEDTRVKIPATIQFMRLGYEYLPIKDRDVNVDKHTNIVKTIFKESLERINKRSISDEEIEKTIREIETLISKNDLGESFRERLWKPNDKLILIDKRVGNNTFLVTNELSFYNQTDGIGEKDRNGSFRPDTVVLINGMPLSFLDVKKPNNEGGIKAEFDRMINKRLEEPGFEKYFNMLQVVSFSNNMPYDDIVNSDGEINGGSFYAIPSGKRTKFQFLRDTEEYKKTLKNVSLDEIKHVLKDNGYDETNARSKEFETNLDPNTPCNRFITSLYDKERLIYLLRFGIFNVNGRIPERHIMRYPQFFASRRIVKRIKQGQKRMIVWHGQGSGKTELAAFMVPILSDYYSQLGIVPVFHFIVDRIELLLQVRYEMMIRGINVISINSREEYVEFFKNPSSKLRGGKNGEIVVVNIQKFSDDLPSVPNNVYGTKFQHVVIPDEAHRSYTSHGEFYRRLITMDENAVFIALTGTPILSEKERSVLKFGSYVDKYFYNMSIADGYTLRIKKEKVETTVRADICRDLQIENPDFSKKEVYESEPFIKAVCSDIKNDIEDFWLLNNDTSTGFMIACASNEQGRKIKKWFNENSQSERLGQTIRAGLVLYDTEDKEKIQNDFRNGDNYDVVIVHQMLTTGYDVPRLKKLYLLRSAHDHNLLQTITRVNRPYTAPNGKKYRYGYIKDYVDISKELGQTLAEYVKELAVDADGENFDGIIIDSETVYAEYKETLEKLKESVSINNLEKFSREISGKTKKEEVLKIKRLLKKIDDCYMELKLSKQSSLADDINISFIRKLLNIVQERIDLFNIRERPLESLNILSDERIVKLTYGFEKTGVEILDMAPENGIINNGYDEKEREEYIENIKEIKEEIKRNKNTNEIELKKLSECLEKIFEELNFKNISAQNRTLRGYIEKLRKTNDTNDILAKRYGNDYAFVKTFNYAIENFKDFNRDELVKVVDTLYKATNEIKSGNSILLHNYDSYKAEMLSRTVLRLYNSGLYKTGFESKYDELLYQTYNNIQIYQ